MMDSHSHTLIPFQTPSNVNEDVSLPLQTPRTLLPRRSSSRRKLMTSFSFPPSRGGNIPHRPMAPRRVRTSFTSSNSVNVNETQEEVMARDFLALPPLLDSTNTMAPMIPSLDSPSPVMSTIAGRRSRLALKPRHAVPNDNSTHMDISNDDEDEDGEDDGFDLEIAALSLPRSSNLDSFALPVPPAVGVNTNIGSLRRTPVNATPVNATPEPTLFAAAAPVVRLTRRDTTIPVVPSPAPGDMMKSPPPMGPPPPAFGNFVAGPATAVVPRAIGTTFSGFPTLDRPAPLGGRGLARPKALFAPTNKTSWTTATSSAAPTTLLSAATTALLHPRTGGDDEFLFCKENKKPRLHTI